MVIFIRYVRVTKNVKFLDGRLQFHGASRVPAGFSPVTGQFVALRPYSLLRQIAVGWLKFGVGLGQQVLG